MRVDRKMFGSETFLAYLAMAASVWLVAIQPHVFKRGEKGAVIAALVILALCVAGTFGVADLSDSMSTLYRTMSGW